MFKDKKMLQVYSVSFRKHRHILILLLGIHLQQKFIVFQALGSRSSNDWSDGPPLSRHQLGQVQEFFLFFSGPFCFLNAWIQPLIPIKKIQFCTLISHLAWISYLRIRYTTSSIWKMEGNSHPSITEAVFFQHNSHCFCLMFLNLSETTVICFLMHHPTHFFHLVYLAGQEADKTRQKPYHTSEEGLSSTRRSRNQNYFFRLKTVFLFGV